MDAINEMTAAPVRKSLTVQASEVEVRFNAAHLARSH